MAAHIVTFFTQVAERALMPSEEAQELTLHQHALQYAKLGDCLDVDDWGALLECPTWDAFVAKCKELQPKYTQKWETLGKPRTAEDWFAAAAKQPPDIETLKRGMDVLFSGTPEQDA